MSKEYVSREDFYRAVYERFGTDFNMKYCISDNDITEVAVQDFMRETYNENQIDYRIIDYFITKDRQMFEIYDNLFG